MTQVQLAGQRQACRHLQWSRFDARAYICIRSMPARASHGRAVASPNGSVDVEPSQHNDGDEAKQRRGRPDIS